VGIGQASAGHPLLVLVELAPPVPPAPPVPLVATLPLDEEAGAAAPDPVAAPAPPEPWVGPSPEEHPAEIAISVAAAIVYEVYRDMGSP
jgi:hypothetical protein